MKLKDDIFKMALHFNVTTNLDFRGSFFEEISILINSRCLYSKFWQYCRIKMKIMTIGRPTITTRTMKISDVKTCMGISRIIKKKPLLRISDHLLFK